MIFTWARSYVLVLHTLLFMLSLGKSALPLVGKHCTLPPKESTNVLSPTILHNFIVTMTTDAQPILVILNIRANKLWVKP